MAERRNDQPEPEAAPAAAAGQVVRFLPAVPAPVAPTPGLDEAQPGRATYLLSDGKTRVTPDGKPAQDRD